MLGTEERQTTEQANASFAVYRACPSNCSGCQREHLQDLYEVHAKILWLSRGPRSVSDNAYVSFTHCAQNAKS